MKKNEKPAGGQPATPLKNSTAHRHHEIKTDRPLIEKDEVKQAEERMRKASKKQ
jgi:hypothetical protein